MCFFPCQFIAIIGNEKPCKSNLIGGLSCDIDRCIKYIFSFIHTLRPGQNGRHFPDDHLKYIFLKENIWIPINISLKCVPKGRINNIPYSSIGSDNGHKIVCSRMRHDTKKCKKYPESLEYLK